MRKASPLLVIFCIVFFDLLSFGIVIPILPYYSKEYGANAFVWSWIMAIYSIAQFLFAPFWGSLSDRYGRRPILLLSILLGAICTLGMSMAKSILAIFIFRLLSGIFAANISTANAYIVDSTTEENRAKGMGIIGAGFGLGFIFGPAIGALLSPYGLSTPLLFAACLGFANFLLALKILKEPVQNQNTRSANRRKFSMDDLKNAFSNPTTAVPILLFFLSTLAFTQLEVSFAFFVSDTFSYSAYQAGLLLAMMGFVMALIQGGGIGRLTKKFKEAKLTSFGFLSMCIGIFFAAFATKIQLFSLCLIAIAIGNACIQPTLSSILSKAAPASHKGAFMGLYQSASSLARIIGPPIAGFAYSNIGHQSPLLLSSLILVGGFLFSLLSLQKESS